MSAADFIMPTSPADIKAIAEAVKEVSNARTRMEAEREFVSEVKKKLKEDFGMPPKLFTRMVKDYHARLFAESVATDETYREMYEKIFGTPDTEEGVE